LRVRLPVLELGEGANKKCAPELPRAAPDDQASRGRPLQLEDELCIMATDGFMGEGSPDQVDALVWAHHPFWA
jgi:phage terminase large subunit-like protein